MAARKGVFLIAHSLFLGLLNAIKAIIRAKEHPADVDVYFRQATDHYDKLRVVQVWGTHGEIKDADKASWKRVIKHSLESKGEILDVAIFSKGFIVVTFKHVEDAKKFEGLPVRFNFNQHVLVASYSTAAPVIFPDDVVLDGFYADDRKNVVNLILASGGPFRRIHFYKLPSSKLAAIISFVQHSDAIKFASLEKIMLRREGSIVGVTLVPSLCKDFNMKKEKRDNASKANQDNAAIEGRIIDLEKRLMDDRKAGVAELSRMDKARRQERDEDRQAFLRVVTESQQRVAQAMAYVVSVMMDKQATINHLTMKMSHCREDRLTISHQIDKWEDNPAKAERVRELIEERKIIGATITKLEEEMAKVLETKVELPMLEAPSAGFHKLDDIDKSSGNTHTNIAQ